MSNRFCKYCGAKLEGNSAFCSACGKPVAAGEAAFNAPVQQPNAASGQRAYTPPPSYSAPPRVKKGLSTGAVIGITAGGIFLLAALAFFGFKLFGKGGDTPLEQDASITAPANVNADAETEAPQPEPEPTPIMVTNANIPYEHEWSSGTITCKKLCRSHSK